MRAAGSFVVKIADRIGAGKDPEHSANVQDGGRGSVLHPSDRTPERRDPAMDHLDKPSFEPSAADITGPPARSIPIAPREEALPPAGPAAPGSTALRRRSFVGMAALALSAAALASGGTVAALGAAGVLDHQPAAVAAAAPLGSIASATVPAAQATATAPAISTGVSSDAVVAAAARVSPAVVTIVSSSSANRTSGGNGGNGSGGSPGQTPYGIPTGQAPVGVGSGVIFDANGWILTNHHVVADGGTLTVQLSDGRAFPAKVYGADTLTDLAIVKIDATGLPTARLGDSSALQVGQLVVAVGDPLGQYPGTVTTGVVSGLGRSLAASAGSLDDLIQTDAAINPGNSGGPLIDANGAVIGIDTAIEPTAQGIGFAIPVNVARPLTLQALAGEKLSRPWLGIRYEPLDAGLAARAGLSVTEGAWITGDANGTAIETGSPAATAGLRENDVIIALDGTKVDTNHPLVELLAQHAPGSTVALIVHRGSSDLTISVTLTTRQATTG
jgi:S1-C subfamily serine protease